MSAAAGGANVYGHLPTWSNAEGRSGLAVKCTRLLCRVFKHLYDMLG